MGNSTAYSPLSELFLRGSWELLKGAIIDNGVNDIRLYQWADKSRVCTGAEMGSEDP